MSVSLRSSPLQTALVPENAAWPRLMTGPHPRAVGTYGPAIAGWALERPNLHLRPLAGLRWWQGFVLDRAFEHDAAGELVWRTIVLSGPRQVGKSYVERIVCGWRMHAGPHFGGPQDVLHMAHKLTAAQEVWRPAARWARMVHGHKSVRLANGEQQIELGDGSRWMIQAANDGAGVAFSLHMALVDEAWKIPRTVVEGGISPTQAEAEQPQLWLVSTANRSSSDLMQTYRATALALEAPGPEDSLLLIEWSAPPDPDLDLDDPGVWRLASPHWDERRQRVMAEARATADEIEFRYQWLNQWLPPVSEPLINPERWQAAEWLGALPAGTVAFGVDVAGDRSHAVIVAFSGGVSEVVDARDGAAWVPARLVELAARWAPSAIGLDGSGPAATVADQLRGSNLEAVLVVMTGRQLAQACGQTYDAISEGTLAARAHEELTEAVLHATRRSYGQSWIFARQTGDSSGVALLAMVCAIWAADHAPTAVEQSAIF